MLPGMGGTDEAIFANNLPERIYPNLINMSTKKYLEFICVFKSGTC